MCTSMLISTASVTPGVKVIIYSMFKLKIRNLFCTYTGKLKPA